LVFALDCTLFILPCPNRTVCAFSGENYTRKFVKRHFKTAFHMALISAGTNFHLPENADLFTMAHPAMLPTINIGETIRNYRLQKGMSQGDIEKRTGLLRCYLSRVENGHTIPSLDTLSKIAGAMEIALSQFFSESGHANGSKGLPQLSDDEVRFLSQVRRYATNLNESDRKLVLAMVKKMASNAK
jgi:transcriptional regulator with XRE-family HTH domain